MKKGHIVLIVSLILALLAIIIENVSQNWKKNHLEMHTISEYHFVVGYPKSFQDVVEPSLEEGEQISSNVKIMVSGEEENELMKRINLSKNVVNVQDELKQLRMFVDAINIKKANLALEEICKRYAVMFRIYNEDAKLVNKENSIVNLHGMEVGKVILTIKGKEENSILVAYLFSFENQEVTLTFITPESQFAQNEKLMNKIAKSIKTIPYEEVVSGDIIEEKNVEESTIPQSGEDIELNEEPLQEEEEINELVPKMSVSEISA